MKKIILFFLFLSTLSYSQVKTGNTPSIIKEDSLLELKSSNKVINITFLINSISPIKDNTVYALNDKYIESVFFIFNNLTNKLTTSHLDTLNPSEKNKKLTKILFLDMNTNRPFT